MPWADREFKRRARDALKLLRKTGLELLRKRESEMIEGNDVPEDILTQICRYKGEL